MRVIQVGDVADVASALEDALAGHVEISRMPIAQAGAARSARYKLLFAPRRLAEAIRVASLVNRLGANVVHIHWLPNGLVGLFLRSPWVLHCHGSDVRELTGWRGIAYGALVRRASTVVYSTPDLKPAVARYRPDAAYLPTPIRRLPLHGQARRDVLVASRAARSKGSDIAAAGLRRLREQRPTLSIAAIDGPDFEHPADRLPFMTKSEFWEELASSRVVVGQFALRALGISELEAMSCGRPVVTAVDPQLYPTAPPVMNATSAAGIADAVARLLDDAALAEDLGQRGRQWVSAHFAPEAVAKHLIEIYADTVEHASH